MPIVLIADKLPQSGIDRLSKNGCEVTFKPGLNDDQLRKEMADLNPEVLIVRSTKVGRKHIEAATRLSLIVRAGAGVNNIDIAAASSLGVHVSNCPGKNAVAVAELAWGHIINGNRRISDCDADLKRGLWKKKTYAKSSGLHGRTLGVIGCGKIGQEVITRAHAFGMNVVAWSRSLTDQKASDLGVTRLKSIMEVAQASSVVTVHLAVNSETRGMFSTEFFENMQDNALFVNTCRGELVIEEALIHAINTKGITAGLDVFCDEPKSDGEWSSSLSKMVGVYGTHHIGASTDQAQEAVAYEACRIVISYQENGVAPNCVNLSSSTLASHLMVIRHKDQVGVLSEVLSSLKSEGINVKNMDNSIFATSDPSIQGAANARIQLVGAPSERLLQSIDNQAAVLEVKLISLETKA
jgi:D-3-phosphoglycerate dehydrogenase